MASSSSQDPHCFVFVVDETNAGGNDLQLRVSPTSTTVGEVKHHFMDELRSSGLPTGTWQTRSLWYMGSRLNEGVVLATYFIRGEGELIGFREE